MNIPDEIQRFCPKRFYGRNAVYQGRFTITYGTAPGALRSDGKTFLTFAYVFQEDVAKISRVLGAPSNVNSARAITWLASVTICCIISQ